MRRSDSVRGTPGEASGHHVVITEYLAGAMLSYLSEAGEHERGGVLLGHRNQSVTWVSMAVFPPQLLRDRIACEFDVSSLSVIHTAKDLLNNELAQRVGTIVGWVHSHPKLGLFLSPTDEATLSAWRQLDPRSIAVVADPYLPGPTTERLAWWHVPGPAYHLAIDRSVGAILTIQQVAAVAEAVNRSADSYGRWDIVTDRTVMRIIASPTGAAPRIPAQEAARGQEPARGQLPAQGQGPRPEPAQQPGRDVGGDP